MKKVLALALVLAMAATLFVAAPANAQEEPTNLLTFSEENTPLVNAVPWEKAGNSGFFNWLYAPNNGFPANMSMMGVNTQLLPYPANSNVKYGNKSLYIDLNKAVYETSTHYDPQNHILLRQVGITPGEYTFYYWVRLTNVPADKDVGMGNIGWGMSAFAGDWTKNPINAKNIIHQNCGWETLYDSIAQANADTTPAGDDGSNANNTEFKAGQWKLMKMTFDFPDVGATEFRIDLNTTGTQWGKFSFDGFGLVKGNKVPADEVAYANDNDRDGIKDNVDADFNGDGILNKADTDGDGLVPDRDIDADGDGILNKYDPDIDGDSIRNIFDKDMDNDGLLNPVDPMPMGLLQ